MLIDKNEIDNAIIKNIKREELKIQVLDVSCFSMDGSYICPYYYLPQSDKNKQHECNKCWGIE